MRNFCFVCILIAVSLASCKKDPKKAPDVPNPEEKLEKLNIPRPAAAEIDDAFREKVKANPGIPDIENGIWHYQFGLSIKDETPKENLFKGQWLDLNPGGNYAKGLYADTTESGLYTYDAKSKIIQMRAYKTASSEWKVMVDPDHMVLVGTSTYGNNTWQIKLKRSEGFPTKEETK